MRRIAPAPAASSLPRRVGASCRPCSASHAVEIVARDSITRTDFKARRVIDDREVFRGLNDQLAAKDAEAYVPPRPCSRASPTATRAPPGG